MYIVLEYYLVENFLINFLLLHLTNKVTKSKVGMKSIILGSIISSLYSLIVFVPSLLFLTSFIGKLFISTLIVYITFQGKSIKLFLYQLLTFYIVSFIFAGSIMGLLSSLTNLSEFVSRETNLFQIFTLKHIGFGIVIAIIISSIVFTYSHRKKQMESFLTQARIEFRNKVVSLTALIDTGNTLKDPLSKKPVFVVELSRLITLLPEKLLDYYMSPKDMSLEELFMNLREEVPLILVPFKSLGNEEGLILGFNPDLVIVQHPTCDAELEVERIIIGIYNGKLSSDNEFSGLIDYETIVEGGKYYQPIL